ncbi:MAG: efflux RND transporter periplasmic adaptor subunit [Bacteroidales bacterium]|jgi:RND family efflux transporter MFP subunit
MKILKSAIMTHLRTFSATAICILAFTGCSSKATKTSAGTDPVASATEKNASPVKEMILAKTKIARTIEYTATLLPFEEVNLAPSTPGRIEKIFVEVGEKVNKGDRLFQMDRTQLYQMKLQLGNLEKDLNRLDTLLKTGSTRQQQYDQLKTQYDVTKTNVDFMEQNTLMRSPFDGIITGKYFENGEMYSGLPSAIAGKSAVVTVQQVNPLKVNLNITEQYYPLIRKGMKADVIADVYKNETFTASIFRIAPTVNSGTRSFITEMELPNRNDMLKPGMFVRVSLDLGEVETFVVPANTILVQEGTNIRFVFIDNNGIAERVEVNIGKRFDDKIEIISEKIKEGDKLVTDGQARLINGDKIEVNS